MSSLPIHRIIFVFATFVGSCTHSQRALISADLPSYDKNSYESKSREFMVVSQGRATTLAAREMFLKGGNIIDAATAASFTIAVERPQSTGIAGGGFMMIHLQDKEDWALDFREVAPARASKDMFLDQQKNLIVGRSTDGAQASGVPGMVAGVLAAHRKYGKLPLKIVMEPAIRLAKEGFPVYQHLFDAAANRVDTLRKSPAARKIFLDAQEKALPLGQLLKQPDLARVLETIAQKGEKGFYQGWVAKAIVAEQKRSGGLITQKDLDAYQPKWRRPLRAPYKNFELLSMPPSSSGGVHVLQILKTLEKSSLGTAESAATIHKTSTAMQLAFRDRARYLGDSDFVKVPLQEMIADSYVDDQARQIPEDRAIASADLKTKVIPGYESLETTHFSIADKDGNVVSSTQTINGWFGSGVVVPGTGMVMNNEMDDFVAKPGVPNKFGAVGNAQNAIAPNKRPLSSMSPTIVLEQGKPVLTLGSPAGTQIITCVSLTILNHLHYRRPIFESVTARRYHHQWLPDQILVEKPGFEPQLTALLEKMGHKVVPGGIGCKVQAIAIRDGELTGASDPRGEGLAAGDQVPASGSSSSSKTVQD